MLKKAKLIPLKVVLTVALSALVGCGQLYWSDPITGVVVDAATKAPLPGVSVVAHWPVYGGLEGGNFDGNLNLMETETDKAGRFSFPNWGPKRSVGIVRHSIPHLIFFRSGFKVETKMNVDTRMQKWTGEMRSDWTGKTIELESMEQSSGEYVDRLEFLSDRLMSIGDNRAERCDWEKLTHTIVAIEREYRILQRAGVLSPNKNNVYRQLASNNSVFTNLCSVAPTALLRGVE